MSERNYPVTVWKDSRLPSLWVDNASQLSFCPQLFREYKSNRFLCSLSLIGHQLIDQQIAAMVDVQRRNYGKTTFIYCEILGDKYHKYQWWTKENFVRTFSGAHPQLTKWSMRPGKGASDIALKTCGIHLNGILYKYSLMYYLPK